MRGGRSQLKRLSGSDRLSSSIAGALVGVARLPDQFVIRQRPSETLHSIAVRGSGLSCHWQSSNRAIYILWATLLVRIDGPWVAEGSGAGRVRSMPVTLALRSCGLETSDSMSVGERLSVERGRAWSWRRRLSAKVSGRVHGHRKRLVVHTER